MKFFSCLFALVVLGFSAVDTAFPQTGDDAGPGTITGISITGLKRTKPHVAEGPLKKFIGRQAVDVDEVHAAILDAGILEPVSIEIGDAPEGDGKILNIEVREKWSIFPLPIVSVNSGGTSGGGFFVDTNAFGLNDKFVAGGLYGSGGWTAMLMYINTPDREQFPGWTVGGMYSRQDREDTDQNEVVFRSFPLDSLKVFGGISYPFLELFSASLDISFNRLVIRDDPPEDGGAEAQAVGLNPGLSVSHSDWDGYLLSRQSVSLGYEYTIGIDFPDFQALSFQGIYEKSLIPGFRAAIHSGALFAPGAPALFESPPSAARVNILPSGFSARHYGGVSMGLEKYLLKTSFGILSILASYQLVYSWGPVLKDQWDHGVAGALSFYLSRLALPAMGLGLSYNVAAAYFQGYFNIGMSF
ncbi:MAG: hypothetical protein LBP93_00595 [Treponema sp.]|nr:hypothetical protein [Treponema sp.]